MVIVHRKDSKYSNKQVIFYSSVGKPTAPLITRSALFILLIFNIYSNKKKLECSALGKRSCHAVTEEFEKHLRFATLLRDPSLRSGMTNTKEEKRMRQNPLLLTPHRFAEFLLEKSSALPI